VKIINVLKDDSFDEILELFRKAPEGEVFLVLPKNGKLFRHEDHFAAFASEASQARKTVSIMTPNDDTAKLARKFGFAVIASQKPRKGPAAVLASAPPPADADIHDDQDDAFADDVPMTSDATMGNQVDPLDEVDPLRNMTVVDADGNPVDDDEDGKTDEPEADDLAVPDSQSDFVAAPEAAVVASLAASRVDGVRGGSAHRTLTPTVPRGTKDSSGPVSTTRELDYIDAMWRDKVGKGPVSSHRGSSTLPSFFARAFGAIGGSAFPKKVAVGILLLAMVILGSVVYTISGEAHVSLSPIGKTIDTQLNIQASDTYGAIDETFLKIPGQLLEVTKTASNTVTATGKRDVASKARGKITVINEFSSTPQTLVATTRFQSTGGQVFRTLRNVTVPGSTVSAGKTVAGKVTVDVIADKPGTDYNIPAGKFVIMAFIEKGDTEKAKQLYGAAEAAMSGGASGPSTVVTQANYDSAQAAALAAVKEQIKTALEAQGPSLTVIDGDAPVMKAPQSSARADDAAEAVTATATGTLKTIAFRGSDLAELIRKTMLKKDRLVVIPEKLKLSYSNIAFNADLGTLSFTVSVKGTGYVPVDVDSIKSDIAGKNVDQVRDYFKSKEGVGSATAELAPFWVRSVPADTSKITVEVLYEDNAQEGR
jgi:hypothetical protein